MELLTLTREHIFIVFLSAGLAILVGLPLGILLTRIKSLQTPILGFANVMQTVPSLALFGLLIPLPFIGGIGARTAVIALALYALLPVIRNTVTGILGIDPKVREKVMGKGDPKARLRELIEALPAMDFATDQTIEDALKALVARQGLGFGDYQAVARLALSGTNVGPSITGMIRVLGRERVAKRLERFLSA